MWVNIFQFNSDTELAPILRTSKQLYVIATRLLRSRILAQAFGKFQWEQFFGEVGDEPGLPENIIQLLKSPCPFWPDKKLEETHLLTLIPKTIKGNLLTMKYLGELIQHPKKGKAISYLLYPPERYASILDQYGDVPVERSHWVLMTKDMIPGSSGKYAHVLEMLIAKGKGYTLPKALGALVSILMDNFAKGKTREKKSRMYTRCQEISFHQGVVGGLGPDNIEIYRCFDDDCGGIGAAAYLEL